MVVEPLLSPILDDEALTRGLGDPEARILVEWLVDRAEQAAAASGEAGARAEVTRLCRRGRAISRFVGLYCHEDGRAAAMQLAGSERFTWPLPTRWTDPCELMHSILQWEGGNHGTCPH